MKRTALLAALLTGLSAWPALAHTGTGVSHGFFAGFGHPLSGADHIVAMAAVGLWAALLGGRAMWIVPLAFVTAMAGGGALGVYGFEVPFVEAGIVGSILALGLLVAFNVRIQTVAAAAIAAVFAIFHGHAHGTEMPLDASGFEYAAGFIAATAILHGVGLAGGVGLIHSVHSKAVRALGGLAAAAGAAFTVLG